MGNLGCKAGYRMIQMRQNRKGCEYGQVMLPFAIRKCRGFIERKKSSAM